MRFCLGVIPKMSSIPLDLIVFCCNKLMDFCPNITSVTKYGTLRLRPF